MAFSGDGDEVMDEGVRTRVSRPVKVLRSGALKIGWFIVEVFSECSCRTFHSCSGLDFFVPPRRARFLRGSVLGLYTLDYGDPSADYQWLPQHEFEELNHVPMTLQRN